MNSPLAAAVQDNRWESCNFWRCKLKGEIFHGKVYKGGHSKRFNIDALLLPRLQVSHAPSPASSWLILRVKVFVGVIHCRFHNASMVHTVRGSVLVSVCYLCST
jgi:hypothetical protein